MNTVYLIIGGNLGDRIANLHEAILRIEAEVGLVSKKSAVFETAAWGFTEQPAFLNQVIEVSTPMTAPEVLQAVLGIELEMGRIRISKLGPRNIDIDILFYNNEVISSPNLQIPHPDLHNRRFVLVPLAELTPQLIHPVLNKTVIEMLNECPDILEVKQYEIDKEGFFD